MSNNLKFIGSVSIHVKFNLLNLRYYMMLLKFTLSFKSPVELVTSL